MDFIYFYTSLIILVILIFFSTIFVFINNFLYEITNYINNEFLFF